MNTLRLTYPVPLLCRILEVSRGGYYAWLTRGPSKRAKEEGRLTIEIKAAHTRTRETCGPQRLQADLATHGVKIGIFRIRRIRKKLGLRCKQVKKFKATTQLKTQTSRRGQSSGSTVYRNGTHPGLGVRSELRADG